MTAPELHIGDVVPAERGFTWTCRCGAKPDPITSWGSYDGAAAALGRHVHKMTAPAAERWVVKEIPDTRELRRFYVQDTRLGYCTETRSKREAEAEARRRNRDER